LVDPRFVDPGSTLIHDGTYDPYTIKVNLKLYTKPILSLSTWSKQKWLFWRTDFCPASWIFLNTF